MSHIDTGTYIGLNLGGIAQQGRFDQGMNGGMSRPLQQDSTPTPSAIPTWTVTPSGTPMAPGENVPLTTTPTETPLVWPTPTSVCEDSLLPTICEPALDWANEVSDYYTSEAGGAGGQPENFATQPSNKEPVIIYPSAPPMASNGWLLGAACIGSIIGTLIGIGLSLRGKGRSHR